MSPSEKALLNTSLRKLPFYSHLRQVEDVVKYMLLLMTKWPPNQTAPFQLDLFLVLSPRTSPSSLKLRRFSSDPSHLFSVRMMKTVSFVLSELYASTEGERSLSVPPNPVFFFRIKNLPKKSAVLPFLAGLGA